MNSLFAHTQSDLKTMLEAASWSRQCKELMRTSLADVALAYSLQLADEIEGMKRRAMGIDPNPSRSAVDYHSSLRELENFKQFGAVQTALDKVGDYGVLGSTAAYLAAAAASEDHQRAIKRSMGLISDHWITNLAAELMQGALVGHHKPEDLLEAYQLSAYVTGKELVDVGVNEVSGESAQETIVAALSAIIAAFTRNTIEAPKSISLWTVFIFLLTIAPLLQASPYTEDDRARDDATAHVIYELLGHVAGALTAEQVRSSRLADLPRAAVRGKYARLRELPSKSAKIETILQEGTQVAVLGKCGRWRNIVYVDVISGELQEAWVWSGSIASE